ncbi:MAG: hypothetical protein HC883_04110 [Bdellovibrionaceae bacterium]|nr:hypothetical protein [Pseudobdellovibrionaceae bacterium]
MLFWAALFQITLGHSPAHAEYRAFELVIANPTTGQERVVVSTLDPRQYRHYHPVKLEEQVTYRSTWMCKGNTSGQKPICPKPEE